MKNYLLALAVLAIYSCKNSTEPEIRTAPSQSKTVAENSGKDLNETASSSQVVFESNAFTTIYSDYLAVKGALVNTDKVASKAAALRLFKNVNGVAAYSDLEAVTLPLAKAVSVKEMRVAFEDVTAAVEAQLNQEVITAGTIYKQYCPMAFDGKGAFWLSDSKEVRNPYFGDKMLTCGVVDKEIQ